MYLEVQKGNSMEEKKQVVKATAKYSKERLLKSERLKKYQDLVSVLLEDSKEYSIDEVEQMVQKVLRKEVK